MWGRVGVFAGKGAVVRLDPDPNPSHRVRAQNGSRQRGPPRTRRERVKFADFLLCSIGRSNNMKIYLAGPLFSIAERHLNKELARLLRDKKHEVWLPQEFEQRTMTAKEIFVKDVEGIDWADVVVANMDGPDPDSGTCWECGYAYRKKPVILFRTDFRAGRKLRGDLPEMEKKDDAPYNLMLTEAATKRLDLPFAALDSVADSIDHVLQNLRPAT
jgi:nucleoside 2-deoxyribosyltransferase